MKQTVLRPWTMALCMLALTPLYAQISTGFNFGTATDFVGWDNTMINDPLMIRHDANQPIDWYTNAIQRMRLLPDATYAIGPFAGQVKNGNLLLSPDAAVFLAGAPGPFSLLHLAAGTNNAQQQSFRPWMRTGVTFTGNADHGYIGQKNGAAIDDTDMIIHWSDNPGFIAGPDRLRFIFTSGFNASAPTGATSTEGLEAMRMFPASNDEVFVGVGDWFAAGVEPAERLDLWDGRLRIRQLPTDPSAAEDRIMVVDDDGVVHWRPFADFVEPAASDCDWTVQNANISGTTTSHQVYTAVGSSLLCPDDEDEVGIGTSSPTAKLTLIDSRTVGGVALKVEKDAATVMTTKLGVDLDCHGGSESNTGLSVKTGLATGVGTSSSVNTGIDVVSTIAGTVSKDYGIKVWAEQTGGDVQEGYGALVESRHGGPRNYGVRVYARNIPAPAMGTGAYNYGVWAKATGNLDGNNWAGWFDGKVNIQGGGLYLNEVLALSDGSLKTAVVDLSDASTLLMQLSPKTYQFDQLLHPELGLPSGMQYGLIAQELEQVLPDLVQEVSYPAVTDSLGNELAPSYSLKAVNYQALIPLLIATAQEQQAQIQQLQLDLASCCNLDDTGLDMRSGEYDGFTNTTSLENDHLTITPNPFQERTTLSYLLEAPARVRLQVHTESGMHLTTLRDQPQEPGSYSMTWDTQDLAPGLYYVTLFADGKPVVKKAVKVR